MLSFYFSGAPNPIKVALFLEEAGLPYEAHPIDTRKGEQHKPEFLALNPNARTIRGLTFYEHKETPGLGGEVDNPRWKALWPGRLATDENGVPKISVVKGRAGPVSEDPYHVDGLSGATITSNGVTNLMDFWLGENGFGPYLSKQRAGGGS